MLKEKRHKGILKSEKRFNKDERCFFTWVFFGCFYVILLYYVMF